ncbi:hypothetical protein ACHAXA_004046 [Cyclostephanos tholiformis]|uniref:BCNT-C domain-containing protein n=1 Tax=Cyclostephanos tholiformis TaxID=382380 RepID=A0ABD3R5P2_9STRA
MDDDDGESNDDHNRATMDNDEEEEEDDDDYVPDADPYRRASDDDDSDDDHDVSAAIRGAPPTLTMAKRKAVDDAFAELFGYEYQFRRDGSDNDDNGKNDDVDKNDNDDDDDDENPPSSKRRRSRRRTHAILSTIFGKRTGMELDRRSKFVAMSARPKSPSSGGMIRLEKQVVVEIKRFAGQEIRVERVVTVPVMSGDSYDDNNVIFGGQSSSPSSNIAIVSSGSMPMTTSVASLPAVDSTATSGGGAGKRGGVDVLLAEMSKPEKLSAISKTSADWDLFKAKNVDVTLGEQLESKARGNEAYLVKKDFLTRVDQRRFELEKAERDRERSKRGK